MSKLKMFCLTMRSNHLSIINKFNYLPVGLGKDNFSEKWFLDNTGDNISKKINILENIRFITGYGKII